MAEVCLGSSNYLDEDQIRPGFSERNGSGLANSSSRAGEQGRLAL